MTTNIKISVIVAAYNCESTLDKCLNSLRQQTLTDIEIICIDDHSKDRTPHILLKHSQFDARVKIITLSKNCKQGAARNLGISTALGKYICFLDADDFFHDVTALNQLYITACHNFLDVVIFAYKKFYTNSHLTLIKQYKNLVSNKLYNTAKDKEKILLASSIGVPWNKIYRKDFLVNNHITFTEKLLYEDIPFFFKAIILAKDIQIMDQPFITYCKRPHSTMKIRSVENTHIITTYTLVADFLKITKLYETFEYAFIYKSFGAFFKKLKDIPWAYKQLYLRKLQNTIKNINLSKYKARLGKNFTKFQKLQNINGNNRLSLLMFILFP